MGIDTYCCVDRYSLLWRAMREQLSKLNMYIPLDPGNPLPGIEFKEIFVHAGQDLTSRMEI